MGKIFGLRGRLLAGAVLGAMAPGMAAAASYLNAPGDVAAINKLEEAYAVELKPSVIAGYFAPDALVIEYMAHGIHHGRAEIVQSFGPQLAPLRHVTANIREANIVTDGRFACDAMTLDFRFTLKNGKSGTLSLRQLDALRKTGGQWQIVEEQLSWPMDAKTGKAVMHGLAVRGDMDWPGDVLDGPAVPEAQGDGEIRQWLINGEKAIGIDAVMAGYGPADNEALLYGEIAPGNLRGKTEIRAYYAPAMGSFKAIEVTNPVLQVDGDGLLGAQIDTQDITLHMNDGKVRHMMLRQSDCLHRVNGKWYSIEEMVSFPADLATGRMMTAGGD